MGWRAAAIGAGILALVSLLLGYRMRRLLMALLGFATSTLAITLAVAQSDLMAPEHGILAAVVVSLIPGMIGFVFPSLGVFCIGGVLGILFAPALLSLFGLASPFWAAGLIGLLGGAVLTARSRFTLILLTAATGAALFAAALSVLLNWVDPQNCLLAQNTMREGSLPRTTWLTAGACLAVGLFIQFATSSPPKRRKSDKRRRKRGSRYRDPDDYGDDPDDDSDDFSGGDDGDD